MTQHPPIAAASPPHPVRRGTDIALWALQAVTAVAILGAGISTIIGAQQAMTVFDAIGAGDWFRYLTGVLEVAGAVGLLIPRLCGLAALALAVLWLVAIATHLLLIGGNPAPAIVFVVLTAVIAWGRRASTLKLLPGR
ncbi:MAG TPA: DoxX family protein [Pseudonocardiaceae bacterium]